MLYLIATPIGNLSDMTYRAVELLKQADYILCEDTRHSRVLLDHYSIETPLKSCHKFNEKKILDSVLTDLRSDKTICLISDAGTPGISDPGSMLVEACAQEGLVVSGAPGACSPILGLTLSGLDASRFQFIGFLPKKDSELKSVLREVMFYKGTSICFVPARDLLETLEIIQEYDSLRRVAVAKELTKKFELLVRGSAEEVIKAFSEDLLRGEMVLMISGASTSLEKEWLSLTLEEHLELMQNLFHMPKLEAIKAVAQLRGIPKREVYKKFHS